METTTTHITSTMTPTEIDTIWLDASWEVAKNFQSALGYRDYIKAAVGRFEGNRYANNAIALHPTNNTRLTWTEAKAIALDHIANKTVTVRNGCMASSEYIALAEKYAEAAHAAAAVVAAADEQWIARQWNRYFLVASSNGHIHSSTNCHTCNKGKSATQFALVPSLSGTSVEEAVATLGSALCSVCFPDAPVEYREQVKVSKAQATILREQGEAAFHAAVEKAAARAAKKAAK